MPEATALSRGALSAGHSDAKENTLNQTTSVPRTVTEFDHFFDTGIPTGYNKESTKSSILTYGEILTSGIANLLKLAEFIVPDLPNRTFLDLGSGVGKGPIVARLLTTPFEKNENKRFLDVNYTVSHSIGIELSETRHKIADFAAFRLSELDDEYGEALKLKKDFKNANEMSGVSLFPGDILEKGVAAIAASDIIWISNVCFPPNLNYQVSHLIDAYAKPGAVIFASKQLFLQRQHKDFMYHDSSIDEKTAEKITNLQSLGVGQSWDPAHNVYTYHLVDSEEKQSSVMKRKSILERSSNSIYGRQVLWSEDKRDPRNKKSVELACTYGVCNSESFEIFEKRKNHEKQINVQEKKAEALKKIQEYKDMDEHDNPEMSTVANPAAPVYKNMFDDSDYMISSDMPHLRPQTWLIKEPNFKKESQPFESQIARAFVYWSLFDEIPSIDTNKNDRTAWWSRIPVAPKK